MASFEGGLSELRIVLLGYRNAGKRSSGNTILGEQMFHTDNNIQCVKRHGKVAGRLITVVSAPSWEKDKPVEQATELFKHELVLSVTLCPPGPHALLLIIPTDVSFTEKNRSVLEGYLDLIGENIWNNILILFTVGDWLGVKTIEQHIEYEGEALQWLVEKCDDRYHVFNNVNRRDKDQVAELLEKIEEMLIENKNHYFEVDKKILQLEERSKAEVRAVERMMVMQKQREDIRSQMSQKNRHSELRLVLLGYTTSGKSSTGNSMFGKEVFEPKRNAQCVKGQGEVAGRKVTVVEAPGWRKYMCVEESPALLKQEIVLSVSQCPPGPHAVLLTVRVDSAFKEHDKKVIQGYIALLGERVWNYTVVLFTSGKFLGDVKIEQHIECEGEALQWLVEKCGNRYHVLGNKNNSEVKDLLEKIEELIEVNNGCHFEIDSKILQEVEERRSKEVERAKERKMKVQKHSEGITSKAGNACCPSEIKVVLMGFQGSGKSTIGNALLGSKEFELNKAAENAKGEGTMSGKQITVVEASDWRCNNVEESAKLYQMDIQQSVCQCFPGPHALLLIIRVDSSYDESHRKAVDEHLNLLGQSMWSHTMVVFNFAHWLGNISIEQYIESEGKALEWLVEKCENRYHLYNGMEGSEPTELLKKIEEMVIRNGGAHFEIHEKILKKMEGRTKLEEKARARQLKVQKRRERIKEEQSFRLSSEDKRPQVEGMASPKPSNSSTKSDRSLDLPLTFNQEKTEYYRSTPAYSYQSFISVQTLSTDQYRTLAQLPQHQHPVLVQNANFEASASSSEAGLCEFCSLKRQKHHCFCLFERAEFTEFCLNCRTYFCETHLRQHYKLPDLQIHNLVEVNVGEKAFSSSSQRSGRRY